MIPHIISSEAEAAAQRYEVLIQAWRGIFSQALSDRDFGTAAQIARITDEAYSLGRTHLDSEQAQIASITDRIASDAHRSTLKQLSARHGDELEGRIDEHLIDNEQYLARELSIQVERDIATLIQTLRRTYLTVTLAARGGHTSLAAALAEHRIGAAEPAFVFMDRAHHKWSSRRFIRTIWRQHLLTIFNETVLLVLADHGIEVATVEHMDPHAEFHGMLVSLTPSSELPTYAEIRESVFHPNADAILRGP